MYMSDYFDAALYGPSHFVPVPSMRELVSEFCKPVNPADVIKQRFGDVNPLDCAQETTIELRPDGREEFKIRGTLPDVEMRAKARHEKYSRKFAEQLPPYAYRRIPEVKEVFFNGRATTIAWMDGTKTTVRAQEGVEFDEYAGICACLAKKVWGSSRVVKKLLKSDKIHRQRGKEKAKKGGGENGANS